MLSPDRYQEVLAFAHGIAESFGCDSYVRESRIVPEYDQSIIEVQFTTRGRKCGYAFSDAELEYCRLPVAEYAKSAFSNQLGVFKIYCDSNRRGSAGGVE
jgi:hypothetical protein